MQRGGAGVIWLTLNASFASVFLFAIIAALPERFSSPVATVSTSESLMGEAVLFVSFPLVFEFGLG